ncbi:Ig-like domain-containing protein [Streptomyces sp. NPDC007983]|uniref:Ig-like domain-containing protein n=1 Tax=Streptomyces sp. NPDC007983 TaxID=3364800 RepID=UPI0036E7999B
MLIPHRPDGLTVLTDRHGKRVAVIDPASRTVVHLAGGPAPLMAPGLSGRLAVPTGVLTAGPFLQTVNLVNGSASATFNPLPKGTYTVTANYNGSVNYAPSAGTTTQVVTNPS